MKNKTTKEISGIRLLFGYVGLFLIFIGVLELLPAINVIFYPSEISEAHYFIYPGFAGIVVGFSLFLLIFKKPLTKLTKTQGVSLLLLVWICAIFMFSIPWFSSGKMSFSRAIFECTSGFTTTGMTTCDVANTSHVFLFSRALMTFCGGIGLVLILSTAINDKSRTGIFTLEGHTDKLLPNLAHSARLMFSIYLGISVLGSAALRLVGLNWFDAITTTMSSISTGGFCTNPQSVAGFNNLWAEIIIVIEMVLGASNFLFLFFLIKGQFRKAFKNFEFKVGLILASIVGGLMVVFFAIEYNNFGLGLRYGLFQYFTSMTGAGFTNVTTPMMQLPAPLLLLTFVAMAAGGQSGSTAGGIKHFRLSYIYYALKESIYRKSVGDEITFTNYHYKFGEKSIVSPSEKKEAVNYAFLYIVVAIIGGLVISFAIDPTTGQHYGATESFFEFLSCLGTTGLSSGVTSANTPAFVLWVESFGMFFGRLELTILFVYIQSQYLFIKEYNSKKKSAKPID